MSPRLLHLLRNDKAHTIADRKDGMAAAEAMNGFSSRRTRIGYGHGTGRWVPAWIGVHSFKLSD
jgi:hypothetical protein